MTFSRALLLTASTLMLSACASFSPDGGLQQVGSLAGVEAVALRTPEDEAQAHARVKRLLKKTLTADDAVQIALLNNRELQAAYNALGLSEAEMIEASFAIMHKMRVTADHVEMTEVTGKVRDRIAIVGDDVSTTGSTLIAGARALKDHGATEVNVFVTHALFSGEALERLDESEIDRIVVTDSVPIDPRNRPEKMTVLSVSGLLAEAIMNVFADDSVSAIFGGENQLF